MRPGSRSDAHCVKLDTYLQQVRLGDRRRGARRPSDRAALYAPREQRRLYADPRRRNPLSGIDSERERAGGLRAFSNKSAPRRAYDLSACPRHRRAGPPHPSRRRRQEFRDRHGGGAGRRAAEARPSPVLKRLGREGARLAAQLADLLEHAYEKTFLGVETTTVGFR